MEALYRHASLMHHTPPNPFSHSEEPIAKLSASLIEKLQKTVHPLTKQERPDVKSIPLHIKEIIWKK